MQLVDEEGDFVVFNVLKYTCTPQPSLVSSSASSGQMLLQESSPDMLSISPQSGRSQSWHTTPSPDPKLDLLHMQTSTDSHTDESPSMTSSTGSQHDPKAAAALMDRAGVGKVFSHRQHDSKSRVGGKSSYLSPSSPTSPMSMSTSSTTPASPSPASPSPSPQDEEDEVIKELKDIYKTYSSKPSNSKSGLKKDKLGLKSDKSKENGGTWPKCQGPPDFGPAGAFQTVIHAGKKDRPHLSGLFNSDHADYKHHQTDSRVPPTPPERSDSFKKASIKDSSQNTEPMSKYPYRVGGSIVGVKTVTPGYLTSLSHSQTDAKSTSMDKSAMFDKSNSLPGSCYYPPQVSTSSCPPSSSSSPANSYMSGVSPPFSPDHTVVSAKADQKDVRSYLHSRRHHHNRPTSAPSGRGRQERQEFAVSLHSRPPQKPTSLDIQPFSPRPLPHSGHTIMPFSQPVSPRDSMSSTSSSCGISVNAQSTTSTPTSPTHNNRYVPSSTNPIFLFMSFTVHCFFKIQATHGTSDFSEICEVACEF